MRETKLIDIDEKDETIRIFSLTTEQALKLSLMSKKQKIEFINNLLTNQL